MSALTLRGEIAHPFVVAAREVLEQELGASVQRGKLRIDTDGTVSDVTAVIGLTGALSGALLITMTVQTALALVGGIMGQQFDELDALARSGIGELGNVISGRASVLLERSGVQIDVAPPMLLLGAGGVLSSLEIPRLVVPILTGIGWIHLQLALKRR